MHIDDLLEKHSPMFDNFLFVTMEERTGKDLLKRIHEVFPDPHEARNWYYSHNFALTEGRPYDLCVEGHHEDVYRLLDMLDRSHNVTEHGVYD